MAVLEDMDCLYIFGLSARRARGGKEKVRRFFQTHYAARSWRRDRRVISRVEATALGSDTRFIVTNIAIYTVTISFVTISRFCRFSRI